MIDVATSTPARHPIALNPASPVPLHHQLTQHITSLIDDELLHPGERVEAMAALARRLRLSATTVRTAYTALLCSGHIERHPRSAAITVRRRWPPDCSTAKPCL